jgi:ADP-L-glycero-D-manno-heptose 6-epimerase
MGKTKNKQSYSIVTGAAGFIGSMLAQFLNKNGYDNLILVDDFGIEQKRANWEHIKAAHIVERYNLFDWLEMHEIKVDFVFHLGARTDTTEFDYAIHQKLNVEYSQDMWRYCAKNNVPLVYASSAATYGGGEFGYNDDHEIIEKLQPLNPYGISKNEFDKWAINEAHQTASPTPPKEGLLTPNTSAPEINMHGFENPPLEGRVASPPFWAGLKFFNVYGPQEYHKGRMASVIWHAFNQIKEKGQVKLFKSHRPDFKDGEQLRDFVYVKDVVKVMYWLFETMTDGNWIMEQNGLYNLGTGTARSFHDLAVATFNGLDLKPNILFIDMPEDIRDKYQYFTEANMQKLRNAGYQDKFYSLEEGVDDYVRNYLKKRFTRI